MRFWPFRGRSAAAPPPADDLLATEELLRKNVEDLLVVRERQIRGGVIVFRGDLLLSPSRAVDALLERFRAFGYTPFIRPDGDGVVVQAWSPARDRNSLFDIAAAGPLAGLAVALPAVVIGLAWSTVMPTPPGGYLAFGDSLLIRWLVHLRFGSVPGGTMVFTHPVADAAWAGFLVTALNLFPVGQLDGGRIAYALFGRHHRTVGVLTVAGLILMGVLTWSPNWFVWAALLFLLIGFHHGAILDDVTPLSPGRRAGGFACFVLMVLAVPTPFGSH